MISSRSPTHARGRHKSRFWASLVRPRHPATAVVGPVGNRRWLGWKRRDQHRRRDRIRWDDEQHRRKRLGKAAPLVEWVAPPAAAPVLVVVVWELVALAAVVRAAAALAAAALAAAARGVGGAFGGGRRRPMAV